MAKRKTFESGQQVEIIPVSDRFLDPRKWEPATYVEAIPGWRGHHRVLKADGARIAVPSRRIRTTIASRQLSLRAPRGGGPHGE